MGTSHALVLILKTKDSTAFGHSHLLSNDISRVSDPFAPIIDKVKSLKVCIRNTCLATMRNAIYFGVARGPRQQK
jgi:hypothetical protein